MTYFIDELKSKPSHPFDILKQEEFPLKIRKSRVHTLLR